MDFSTYDQRHYPTTDVASGYGEWAATYDEVVRDEMDLRLFARLDLEWADLSPAVDLACGTGRVGAWLRERGVRAIDGMDLTPEMLERARARETYRALELGDLRDPPFAETSYDLATASLVDEHLPDLDPLYRSAARLLRPGGRFVIVGYHPQFLQTVGMPTHYHRADGEAIAIETHVHRLSDHVAAAHRCGFNLTEMHEGVIDDAYVAAKPKWKRHGGLPISFVFAWRLRAGC